MESIAESPVLIGVVVAMAMAAMQYFTTFFARRKTQESLENLRLQAQLIEAQSAAAAALAIEEAKLAAARLVTTTLARAKVDQAQVEAVLSKKLDDLAIVAEQTHVNTNSAKVALDRAEQELRSQLKAQETAAAAAATASALAAQAAKEIAAKDLQLALEKNVRLAEQLAELRAAAPLAVSQAPIPVEVVAANPVPVSVVPST